MRYGAVWHDIWDKIALGNLPQMALLFAKYRLRTDGLAGRVDGMPGANSLRPPNCGNSRECPALRIRFQRVGE